MNLFLGSKRPLTMWVKVTRNTELSWQHHPKKPEGGHRTAQVPPAERRTLATISHVPPYAVGGFSDLAGQLNV